MFGDVAVDADADWTTDENTPVYRHLFFCRSFTVDSSTQIINGNTFTITGTNLKSVTSNTKQDGNSVATGVFETRALHLIMRIENSTSCIYNNDPSASIDPFTIT